MMLRVVPEGLAAISATVESITAQLAASHAAAAPVVSVVVPPAADPVSLEAAAVFSARGTQHAGAAAKGVEVLGRAGLGVSVAGVSYAVGDAATASTY
ncbi:cell motility protein [Mycobacterium sp. 1164966.3]|uniref:PE family protein n=1 Tax=Mycobacterium sp. 1164966.3 TaxID=1856861 RepID=UPI0007FDFE5C|nr:PE family protein [Mycobacterium sp. 1164966.3]OBA82336.1 cell motility protein [Mycobacterium sp. 1164966.3]